MKVTLLLVYYIIRFMTVMPTQIPPLPLPSHSLSPLFLASNSIYKHPKNHVFAGVALLGNVTEQDGPLP